MKSPASDRYQAPISYVDIRRSYNTFRAVGGALIVVLALAAWGGGPSDAVWIALAGAAITLDGLLRRGRGHSAAGVLLLDATVIALSVLIRGHSPVLEGPGFIYIMTGAMLLLPMRRAASTMLYGAVWVLPIVWFAPLAGNVESHGSVAAFEFGFVAVLIALIAELLYSAGRALYHAGERHREALESERRAVRIKDEFVSMVSHELRTPLTSIAGFTDTLRESWSALNPDEVEEFLHIMRRETSHLSDLVEDVLVIPRLEAGKLKLEPTEIDLHHHAYEIAEVIFQEERVEFSVAIPGGVLVEADPVRLKQILRNLLENARKYGGDQVLVDGEAAGGMYHIMVSDNGPGVPPEDRERIFEHFEQASKGDARVEQGVGLGLPIARKLARAMGGDLWYETRFPTGSVFVVSVRRAAERAESDAVPDTAAARTA